jgi:type III restriction enzyme
VPGAEQITVTERFLKVDRLNSRPVTSNLYQKVDKANPVAYEGWQSSMVALEWFDSDPERQMAVLLDQASTHIRRWVRLHRSDGVEITFRGQRYFPDFAAEDVNGAYWLIETKADNELENEQVQLKKAMAEEWARFASDSSDVAHEWHYALVGETQLNNAHSNWELLLAQAGAK